MIAVDTSAWIELFRATGSPIHRTLKRLIEEDAELAVTEVIVMEVLSGARSPSHVNDLRNGLLAFPVLPLNGLAGFEEAAEIYRACRLAGEVVPHPDCLVAAPTIRANATILSADRDFETLARHTALRLQAPDGA
jgi:predicted nucleic acid-binding protein